MLFNPFMPNGNKRLNILKQHKNVCNENDKKKLNLQTHNDLETSDVIAIFAVFKKLSQKRSYKMKYFVFKTLKLLVLEFQF